MSLSFDVACNELPTFNAIVGAADLGEPLQLAGAGWTGGAWPKGLFPKIVDAASAPSRLELTPELEASFSRAGVAGSFLAYLRGAARGVVVARTLAGVTLHVPVLASVSDYLLAAKLAAAAARLGETTVKVHDPSAPTPEATSLAPEAVLGRFTAEAAEAHARQVGTWLVDDIAAGRTYFFQGPRGFVALGPKELAALDDGDRFERARAMLAGADSFVRPGAGARRDAVLLTAAMVYAAGADGVLADEEARQLEAHFATVKELTAFPARELMDAVRSEVSGIDALAELPTLALRRKAFVLASEVIASARGGKLGGEASDPNVLAIDALAKALSLDGDQVFLAEVVRTVSAKYETGAPDDGAARGLVLAMVLTASADGRIDDREAAVLSALARTVPELRGRDVSGLFEAAKARLAEGAEAALGALAAEVSSRNKGFAVGAEVALVAGRGPSGTLLPRLRQALEPDADCADAAIATFAAKYA
jgi:uncharacterized membrane protein YebE (DUF533 family)